MLHASAIDSREGSANRALVRIQLRLGVSYYRRLLKQAARETMHPWIARFGTSAVVGALTAFVSWPSTGSGALTRFGFALAGFAGWLLLILVWRCVTIPPRIEQDWRVKEETLRVLTERRNTANELRSHMIVCRMAAREARAREIEANAQQGTVMPEPYHQRVLMAAKDARERLERLGTQTGQSSYAGQILEVSDAVSAKRCATVEEAIDQLEALADVFERQLSNGQYW